MTMEKIMSKVVDDAGCLIWQQGCCNGHPAMRHDGKTMLVRRVLWSQEHGPIANGMVVRATCGSPRCVNPEHLELTTHQQLAKMNGALGLMSGPVRSAAIARTKRKTHGKLSDAAVRDIRTSNDTGVALAKRYGVSQAHVSKVQKHLAWRNFSSPFAGLGARA